MRFPNTSFVRWGFARVGLTAIDIASESVVTTQTDIAIHVFVSPSNQKQIFARPSDGQCSANHPG